jgi:hypothetical protein
VTQSLDLNHALGMYFVVIQIPQNVSRETIFRPMLFRKWFFKFYTRDRKWSQCETKSPIFWYITPFSLLNANRLLATCFMLISCLAYSSALRIEATGSSETSADFQQSTRRYILEDRTLHNHRCENLKSYIMRYTCCSLLSHCSS